MIIVASLGVGTEHLGHKVKQSRRTLPSFGNFAKCLSYLLEEGSVVRFVQAGAR